MIRKPVLFVVAWSLLFCSGCAAKNRWFSRKDYDEMQDPFMDADALAADDESNGRRSADSKEGRATLGEQESSAETGRSPKPGKSILQTGASSDGVAGTGSFSNATRSDKAAASSPTADNHVIKSYQGPALSDFLGKKAAVAEAGAAVEQLPSTISSAAAATARPSGIAPTATSPRAMSPAARAAALPDLSHEVAGFSEFLQDGSATASAKASQATAAAIDTVERPVEDFSSWANQEQQRWNSAAGNAGAAVSSAKAASVSTVNSMKAASRTAAAAVVEEADFGSPDFEEMDTAEPLMKRATSAANAFEADVNSAKNAAADLAENPFDAEFDTPQPKQAVRKPASPKTVKKSLDSSFQMDSGWKPANLETP